jgi:hypothetical protein
MRQVRPRLTALEQRSAQYAQESKRRRTINPYQKICTGHPVTPSGRMTTFEYPAITGLDLETKLRLLVPASFYPTWLPVDSVDMNDRQALELTKLTRQSAFAGPRLTNNHHPLHRSTFSLYKLIFWGCGFYVNAYIGQQQGGIATDSFRPEDFNQLEGMGWLERTSGLRSRDERVPAFEARRAYRAYPVQLKPNWQTRLETVTRTKPNHTAHRTRVIPSLKMHRI